MNLAQVVVVDVVEIGINLGQIVVSPFLSIAGVSVLAYELLRAPAKSTVDHFRVRNVGRLDMRGPLISGVRLVEGSMTVRVLRMMRSSPTARFTGQIIAARLGMKDQNNIFSALALLVEKGLVDRMNSARPREFQISARGRAQMVDEAEE